MIAPHVKLTSYESTFVRGVYVDGEKVSATEYNLSEGFATVYATHNGKNLLDENGKALKARLYGTVAVDFDEEGYATYLEGVSHYTHHRAPVAHNVNE